MMINFLQTIPLKDPKHDHLLIIMISLMMCSILLIECSALFLTNISSKWHKSVSNISTLEVPHDAGPSSIRKIENLLKSTALVKEYKVANRDKIKEIISPWISESFVNSQSIPFPTIFTIELASDSNIEKDKLKFSLKAINEDVKLETNQNWLSDAFKRAQHLRSLAWIIGGALTITLVVSLSILVRTRILLNTDIINILHVSGASDTYILKQFLSYIITTSLKGVIIGSVIAFGLLSSLSMSITDHMNKNFTVDALTNDDLLIISITPIIIIFLICLSTSRTVILSLKKMV